MYLCYNWAMKNKNIILAVLIIVGLLIGVYYFFGVKNNEITTEDSNENVSVTSSDVVDESVNTAVNTKKEVVKVSVPTKTTTAAPVSVNTNNYIKIGERVNINGVYVTPSKVTYDSRCPINVKCVQAGTVELGVVLESGSQSQNVILVLDKSFLFNGKNVTLTSVSPSKTQTIYESDYRFLITVK